MKRLLCLACVLAAGACDGGGHPPGWRLTPPGDGPRIVWDLYAEPLPEIPLPNDVATWPDPTSPTGIRLNASQIVPTGIEALTRRYFDELDGWGTFAPITVSFDAPIDLEELLARQGGAGHFHEADFAGHAIYVVDMETGLPVPLDLNGGNFQYGVMRTDQYFENDPRTGESNLLFETVEEDVDGDGVLDPGEDTDFDGTLDHPNTLDGRLTGDPLDTYDRMTWFYERETRTLVLRPILPLRQNTTYAVVLTDRLVGEDGQTVRSPLDHVHHYRQTRALERLPEHFAAHPELYGSLAGAGWNGVSFAWTFTTQSVTRDLDTIRDGLYGRGTMSYLANELPNDLVPAAAQGGRTCADPGAGLYIAPGETFRTLLRTVAPTAFGLDPAAAEAMAQSYGRLSHIVIAFFESPYFFTDPEDERLEDAWDVDYLSGRARHTREVLSMMIFVPEDGPEHHQPFEPVLYMHGHGSNAAEVLLYGGLLLQHGNAIVAINAHGHGLGVGSAERALLRSYFDDACLAPLVDALLDGRARDLDGDNLADSGADYWTSYVFHTRDSVRQTIVDEMRAVRILRSFDGVQRAGPRTLTTSAGRQLEFDGDYDRDGEPDLAGDFDGNGTPDLGGPDARFGMGGGSLGGIIAAVMGGVEPAITASAPVVGGGGLADVAIRTENGSVLPAMILRVMGPLVVATPSTGPDGTTSCAAGDHSLRILVPSLDSTARTEFACLPAAEVAADDLLIVRNLENGEVGCSGATGGVAGAFRVPIPSDAGDRWVVEHYRHGRDRIHYGDCRWIGGAPAPDRVIETFEVGNGAGRGRCASCARFETTTWDPGETLVSPTAGFGRRRQTPDFRRLIMLAQVALERGDPVNYARRVFLEPVTAPDVPVRPRSTLVAHTAGDPNVCIATGYALGRATGLVPFLPPDGPAHLADFRAPASFATRWPGFATPNDLVIGMHAVEAVTRLERHPVPGGETFLADVDDLSDGLLYFAADGSTQLAPGDGGVAPVRVMPPMRWARQSRPMSGPGDDGVWSYLPGEPGSAMVNIYVIPNGIHGFNAYFDPALGFDVAVYTFNLLGRYMSSHGTDIPYLSDPTGHHCLEDSSCSYITSAP